jgi:hypothetical protein
MVCESSEVETVLASGIFAQCEKGNDLRVKAGFAFLGLVTVFVAIASLRPANAASASTSIVGDWFGSGQPHDEKMAYLDHIKADGTYVSEFERCKGKVTIRSVQSGRWSASPDILRINTNIVDGKPATFQTDYQMISNDGKNWSYRIVASEPEDAEAMGYLFTAKRVPAYFQLPGCLQIS